MKSIRFFYLASILFIFSFCHKKKKDDTVITIANPVVITTSVSGITNSSALAGGNVTDASNGNVVARGICWGVNQFPSIDDVSDNKTIEGVGTGIFGSQMTNLLPDKTYYVRAYATNEEGTGYGDDMVFTTSPFASYSYGNKIIYVYTTDNGTSAWGPQGITTAATSTSNGSDNTQYISNQTGAYAAKTCADLVAHGYSDWYLPSSGELNAMAQNKVLLGTFNQQEYWSSTETGSNTASSVNFVTATQNDNQSKSQVKGCRCVRKD